MDEVAGDEGVGAVGGDPGEGEVGPTSFEPPRPPARLLLAFPPRRLAGALPAVDPPGGDLPEGAAGGVAVLLEEDDPPVVEDGDDDGGVGDLDHVVDPPPSPGEGDPVAPQGAVDALVEALDPEGPVGARHGGRDCTGPTLKGRAPESEKGAISSFLGPGVLRVSASLRPFCFHRVRERAVDPDRPGR